MVFLFAHRDGTEKQNGFVFHSSNLKFRLVSSTTPHPEVYFVNFGSRFQIRKVSRRSLKSLRKSL